MMSRLLILSVLLVGCGGGDDADPDASTSDATTTDAPPMDTPGLDAPGLDAPLDDAMSDRDSGPRPMARPGYGACQEHADCDDGLDCTEDSCSFSNRLGCLDAFENCYYACEHRPRASRCGVGETCDWRLGCTPGTICAGREDCEDDDPCTTNEDCDDSARACVSTPLDGDDDGHPAAVCGGDDCDDNSPSSPTYIYDERCDGQDQNCNGVADEEEPTAVAECVERGLVCNGERCVCAGENEMRCSGDCLDVSTDPDNCGFCGRVCPSGIACIDGDCACPHGYCDGECVDTRTSVQHCGGCRRFCTGECIDGECSDCGGPGEACCPTRGCSVVTRADCIDDVCVACGGTGDTCCTEGEPCTSELACDAGICPECGTFGQLCCRGIFCTGSECDGGMCTRCGARGEPCCTDPDTAACDGASDGCATDGTCTLCGGEGGPCCQQVSGNETCGSGRTCSDEVCTSYDVCDPLSRSGCASGQGCFPEADTGGACYISGTGAPGDACTIANDCALGSICLARGICAPLCDRVDGVPGCPPGFLCGFLTGFTRIGVCLEP